MPLLQVKLRTGLLVTFILLHLPCIHLLHKLQHTALDTALFPLIPQGLILLSAVLPSTLLSIALAVSILLLIPCLPMHFSSFGTSPLNPPSFCFSAQDHQRTKFLLLHLQSQRWNFRKANWDHYSNLTNKLAESLPPPESQNIDQVYQCFCKVISTAAKKCIPRGRRPNHIPCWDAECEDLYQHFLQSPGGPDSDRAATALLTRLDGKRRNRWSETVRNIDFSHSSRLAWNTINNLTGRSRQSPRQCPVSADAIASQLVKNGKYEGVNRRSSRLVLQEVSDLWRADPLHPANVSGSFSHREFAAALQHLKPGKAPGPDSICPELIIHAGASLKSWLRGFLSSCLHHLKIPKIWRRALVVAIPKPSKPVEDPKSYRPISLLCVPYKILERLIYARVEPLIDPLLPREQAGFRRGRSTVDQVTLLTQSIENAFEAKKKTGAVFIDLTAAYDTVWHRGLTCKLLRLLPDKHMVRMIMELIRNRSFTLTTGDSKPSRLRRLRNGVPQGSVLAPSFSTSIHMISPP